VRTAHRGARPGRRPRIKSLPVRALYLLAELASASGLSERRFKSFLKLSDVEILRTGRYLYVPLTELEEKIPSLWESIKAAEALRGTFDDG
jgi:hypothetical protein